LFFSFIFYRIISVINSSLFCKYLVDGILDSYIIFRHDHISVAVTSLSCIDKCFTSPYLSLHIAQKYLILRLKNYNRIKEEFV